MAYQSVWYDTDLPIDVINLIGIDCKKYDHKAKKSQLSGNKIDTSKRNTCNHWISTDNWVGGLCWHYVSKANRSNFLYDIDNIDAESLQYTIYEEGHYYGWHNDSDITTWVKPTRASSSDINKGSDLATENGERIRKLSFSLQLSDPDSYEGGNLEYIGSDGKLYVAPRTQGALIVFDSRTKHRVREVRKGTRRSIVGWVVGPRWK